MPWNKMRYCCPQENSASNNLDSFKYSWKSNPAKRNNRYGGTGRSTSYGVIKELGSDEEQMVHLEA
ncbi:hypothetical protein Thermo_02050 [Thermoplasmatales archaeon]|nr:hypothetical protein Thermo_02050 [Thermoplasmatales archaeon]